MNKEEKEEWPQVDALWISNKSVNVANLNFDYYYYEKETCLEKY